MGENITATARAWLAFGSIVAAAGCGPAHVTLREAKTCEASNVSDCQTRCAQNDGRACYKLGWFHEEGHVVVKDLPLALRLYEQSCEANWAVACRALGELYWNGREVKPDRTRAIGYWTKACKLGLEDACPTELELEIAAGRRRAPQPAVEGGVSVSVSADAPSAPEPSAPSVPSPAAPATP